LIDEARIKPVFTRRPRRVLELDLKMKAVFNITRAPEPDMAVVDRRERLR
jgi:hypothetical protein